MCGRAFGQVPNDRNYAAAQNETENRISFGHGSVAEQSVIADGLPTARRLGFRRQ